uniref:Uncharacterized protein n=2 Tax=Arundo donax TaxID=35708 RepID=A0A0A9E548_ARUDO
MHGTCATRSTAETNYVELHGWRLTSQENLAKVVQCTGPAEMESGSKAMSNEQQCSDEKGTIILSQCWLLGEPCRATVCPSCSLSSLQKSGFT